MKDEKEVTTTALAPLTEATSAEPSTLLEVISRAVVDPRCDVTKMAALLDFFPQQRSQNKSQLVTNNLYPEFRTAENMHSAHHNRAE